MQSITDVVRRRRAGGDGLGRTCAISLAGHGVLLAVLVVFPSAFVADLETELSADVMNISLGGPAGPSTGGQAALAARPVQEVLPLEEVQANRAQWIQPPTPAPPEVVLPDEDAARRVEEDVPPEAAPEESRGRTPTRGPALREDSALADTGAEGDGVGLSAGGLGDGGELELLNFCCPEYIAVMTERIRNNWNRRQPVTGVVTIRFTIQRDGRISDVERETSSGHFALDTSAERAVLLTRQLPYLPPAFPADRLTVHLDFRYRR
ncbi:MAG: TonB family protein [Acidobacteria bacterium]|nr:TonB family protein [Acidobacteriota bacterium]